MHRIRGPIVLACSLVAAALAGSAALAQTPEVKTGPPRGFVGIEGKDTYQAFCASCHGVNGTGDGPAAPALKMPVPDLTTMAKRSGKFDKLAVERVIERDCQDTWRNIRDDLKRVQLAQLSSPNGTVWQVTEPPADADNRLKALKIKPPPAILKLD